MLDFRKLTEKKSLLILIITSLIIIPILPSSLAEENICDWENTNLENNTPSIFSQNDILYVIQCDLGKQDLRNKIIQIHFRFVSDNNYDWVFVINNSQGVSSFSKPIISWYDITKDEAHIAIDVKDFDTNKISNKISNFQIVTDNPNGIEIIKTELIEIESFETFKKWENIPIQSPLVALVGIFVISFPLGYIIIDKFNLLPNKNFFFSFPWYIAVGLAISLIIIFLISMIRLSFETIGAFLVIEYIVLIFYLYKTKVKNFNFNKTSLFFLLIFCGSLILPLTYSQIDGWAPATGDARDHLYLTTNIIEYQSVLEANPTTINEHQSVIPIYPLAAHSMMASISILTNSFPGATMFALSIMVKILIPVLASTIIYWHTRSIIFSTVMFLAGFLTFGTPGNVSAHIASDVGILLIITSFISFLNFNTKENKKKLIILSLVIAASLSILYFPFTSILFIILIALSPYYIKKIRNNVIFYLASFSTAIAGIFFARIKLENYLSHKAHPYSHEKYLKLPIFNFDQISPYLIGSIWAFFSSIYLFFDNRFRIISVIFFIVFLIHFLSLSEEMVNDYLFFYKALRSIVLVEVLSQIMILLFIFKILENSKIQKWYSRITITNSNLIKIGIVGIAILLLIPSITFHIDHVTITSKGNKDIPGGNEAMIYFWLMDNTSKEDLILNDHSSASQSFETFRFQNKINSQQTNALMSSTYNNEKEIFEPLNKELQKIKESNLILKNPWDYDFIKNTVKEYEIKYIYISERQDLFHKSGEKKFKENTYPDSLNWAWKQYSGNSRIAMYEHHPNLELVLRFGNSALFKVIEP